VITIVNVEGRNVVLAYNLRKAVVKLIANGQDDGTDAEIIKNDLSRDILRSSTCKVKFSTFDSIRQRTDFHRASLAH